MVAPEANGPLTDDASHGASQRLLDADFGVQPALQRDQYCTVCHAQSAACQSASVGGHPGKPEGRAGAP